MSESMYAPRHMSPEGTSPDNTSTDHKADYAPQNQVHIDPKSKLIHQIRGTAEPIIHFADDTGLVASVIKWDDGRLVLRLRGEESTIPEYGLAGPKLHIWAFERTY